MKNVLVILAGSLLATTAKAQMPSPVDSLKISKDVSLDEVVITATKVGKETPVAYSDISKQELSSRNNGQGIPFLISQSPSVIMTSDAGTGIGYSGFRIRGTDANRINITINGVPVNDSESHTVFWANMADIASSVESIQIQRGAGTSTNGAAAFGATVAMQTEKPSLKPYGEYSVSAGSFGTLKHTVKGGTGLLYDHFAFDARYSNIRSDGFIDRASARMSSYYASAAFYADNTLIKFQAFGNSEKTYQAWNGVPSYLLDTDRSYNPCGEYEEDGVKKFYNNQTDNYWQHNYHLMASHRLIFRCLRYRVLVGQRQRLHREPPCCRIPFIHDAVIERWVRGRIFGLGHAAVRFPRQTDIKPTTLNKQGQLAPRLIAPVHVRISPAIALLIISIQQRAVRGIDPVQPPAFRICKI